jgi:hypothetical protein
VTYREVPDDARPITAGADALAVISPNLDGVDRALMLLHGRYQRLALLSNPPYSHLHDRKNSSIGQGSTYAPIQSLACPLSRFEGATVAVYVLYVGIGLIL